MQEQIITPESGMDAIKDAVRSLGRNATISRELGARMFLRDFRAMYRQSILSYFWMFMPPLANTLIWVYLNQQNIISVDTGEASYPIYVLTGTLLWGAFNGSLTGMLTSISEARSVISKINFPHEALLLAALFKAIVNSIIPLALLIPLLPFYITKASWEMLIFPLGVVAIMLLGGMIGIFLVPLATLFTDISRGVQLLLRFAFFLTPVVYAAPKEGIGFWIAHLNPVTPILVTSRSFLLGSGDLMISSFTIITLATIPLIMIGIIIYKISIPFLVERMSA